MNGLQWFGKELEAELRHAGKSQSELAEAIGYQQPYVSKVKHGHAMPSEYFAESCDRFFDTSGSFARLRTRISRRGHPEWFVPYLELEERASRIRYFTPFLVTGLLQTWSYAEALYRSWSPCDSDETIREKVTARMSRQVIRDRPSPPLLWVVLDESCLHRMVGDRAAMRGQMEHLMTVAQTPHVTLQILPYDSGAPAAGEGYTLLSFDDPAQDPVLYAEVLGEGYVIDSAATVATGADGYERLCADALSPEKSLRVLREAIKEFA
ncbi:helix-turn-helix domain-containing protein [Streptomyces yaizuensis]|uniref:helix-turn-helix domain-containing protein n=1 Tax=Streptomyces yaizuensis TaxID=2989713 RepID=UPI002B208EBF|nr:helix-turn-helix transcriptional regulator [Streptomyces sp. YSPA8]